MDQFLGSRPPLLAIHASAMRVVSCVVARRGFDSRRSRRVRPSSSKPATRSKSCQVRAVIRLVSILNSLANCAVGLPLRTAVKRTLALMLPQTSAASASCWHSSNSAVTDPGNHTSSTRPVFEIHLNVQDCSEPLAQVRAITGYLATVRRTSIS